MNRATERVSITFMNGPLDGKTLIWDSPSGQEIFILTIGRRDGCDIQLGYDSQVSRVHARIVYDGNGHSYFLEDVGSRNGTFVGTNRLSTRVELKPGEHFRVGRTWLRIDPMRSAPDEVNDEPL